MIFDLTLILQHGDCRQDQEKSRSMNVSIMQPWHNSHHRLPQPQPLPPTQEGQPLSSTESSSPYVTSSSSRSSSIPLPSSHVARTQSELQLSLDQEAAEQRDASMFYRLVNGIRDRQDMVLRARGGEEHVALQQQQSEKSIARIIHTRLSKVDPDPRLHTSSSMQQNGGVAETQTDGRLRGPMMMTSSCNSSSGLVLETSASDDWSIGGYDDPPPQPLAHPATMRCPLSHPYILSDAMLAPLPLSLAHHHAAHQQQHHQLASSKEDDDEIFDLDL
jgi:hypothetical protein